MNQRYLHSTTQSYKVHASHFSLNIFFEKTVIRLFEGEERNEKEMPLTFNYQLIFLRENEQKNKNSMCP